MSFVHDILKAEIDLVLLSLLGNKLYIFWSNSFDILWEQSQIILHILKYVLNNTRWLRKIRIYLWHCVKLIKVLKVYT